jgi:hypothetical protein
MSRGMGRSPLEQLQDLFTYCGIGSGSVSLNLIGMRTVRKPCGGMRNGEALRREEFYAIRIALLLLRE